ncbi:ribosomal protein S12 methylthiotransferase accessory factor [Stackebrandtia endophytica]|uniref:Ribosomal protein S12 methylthiotransferase accessory factor n=1 Tax=Stackebrandtia endophytica TaxID=1496996 RepID=A0A543B1R2_9ACTN|nr:TOMM precursor leader peptide-binding protein [Stackebrandtia endophytica]TQL78788.1 ribosomal protein S12 methylthiotransferase accessory factor [Stackebrandtia endophytica]
MTTAVTVDAAQTVQDHLDRTFGDEGVDRPIVFKLGEHDLLGIYGTVDPAPFPPPNVTTVHLHGRDAYVLPAAESERPPCALCFQRRWQALRQEEERSALELTGTSCSLSSAPWLTPITLAALATLVAEARLNRQEHRPGAGSVRRMRLDDLTVRTFPLLSEPDCQRCGYVPEGGPEQAVVPMEPRPKPKPDSYRLRHVRDYDLDIDAFANPACGALGTQAPAGFDSPTTMPVTGTSAVRGALHLYDFFWSGHADNVEDSRRLAVLEGLERYAGLVARGLPKPLWAKMADLDAPTLDPRDCTLYTPEYYEQAKEYNPEFTPQLEIPWVWGRNLTKEESVLIPQRLVHYLDQTGPAFVDECSNGCAIGSCPEEAVFHGVMELIERDSFLLTWFAKYPAREIDPRTSGALDIDLMVERMALEGFRVRMFDLRVDLPVPVVAAVAVRVDGKPGKLCFAAGSSMDPVQAMRGALCEIASYVPSFERRMAQGMDEALAMQANFGLVGELKHHALLHGLDSMAVHSDFLLGTERAEPVSEVYREWEATRPRNDDLTDDLRWVIDMLRQSGLDLYAVDQTTPEQKDVGLATYATIVPGLIPIDFGWYKQRAFHMERTCTAHRRAGLRDHDLVPSELNQVPHPFP